ncbi:Hypothetical predicted protein [Mytilus galloprovincialis]|uniref:B box-type domain-containing protein n=1 Tax=Mytilus galloprovincialis TaxID=29158 RepID=A0A8B6CHN8_MYTGA|nr:Hypothetical predicted protein [Mytilus galloprovincialis]
MKSKIKNTKKYASDLQAFLCMREIQSKTTNYEKHLQSSIDNNNHNKINIESAIKTKIQDILMVDKFCYIEVKKSQSTDINLNRRKERQAQMMIPKEVVLINNVKLVFKRKVNQTCMYPTGCCVTKVASSMATFTSVCAVCDHRHQASTPTHWCIECEEQLCLDCKNHHNALKVTRNHKTIPISDYKLLPSVVTDIKQHCVYHNEIYQLYCNKHESPICNKCVKDHGKCGEILSLDEIVKDIKTSESFVDLEHTLDELYTNINIILKDRESNMESIADQKKKISAEVCHIKNKIIQQVNKLEEEFIKELDQLEFDCSVTILSIVSTLQDKAKEINQIKSEIQSTKKYASDLQTFLRMKDIQSKITEFEKDLQSHIQNEHREKITIESETESKIYDFLHIERLGFIKVKSIPSTKSDLIRRKDRQAQIMVPKVMKSINDVKLELIHKFNTTLSHYSGCCVTKQGKFLFSNYESNNAKVIAVNADGEVVYTFPLKELYSAFDVVSLNVSTIAVSTGYSDKKPGVSIVDMVKRKIIKFIDLPSSPYGITYDGCDIKNEIENYIS